MASRAISLGVCSLIRMFLGLLLLSVESVFSVEAAAAVLYEESFNDGNYTTPEGSTGLSWQLVRGQASFPSRDGSPVVGLAGDTLLVSTQQLTASRFTAAFDAWINWGEPSAFVFLYKDPDNYYAIGIGNKSGLYRRVNGVETQLVLDRQNFIRLPHGSFSSGRFKVYVERAEGRIAIKIDRGGDGVDYDLSYLETEPSLVALFGGASKIGLADQVATGSNSVWALFDNLQIVDTLLQEAHAPVKYYVDSANGSDGRTVEEAQNPLTPWKTIGKASRSIFGGDTVIVRPGTYPERVFFNQRNIAGTAEQRTTFKAEPAHGAKVWGFDTLGADYVRIEGFDVKLPTLQEAPQQDWTWGRGAILTRSNFVEVIGNYVHDSPTGITAGMDSCPAGVPCNYGLDVARNHVYLCQMGVIISGENILIEDNDIERVKQWGDGDSDFTRFFGEHLIIRGNHIHGGQASDFTTAHVDGFQTFDNNGEFARHVIIENNLIEDFYHQGLMGEASFHNNSYDITFRNNIFKDAAAWGLCIGSLRDVKVYNNVFMNMQIHSVGFGETSTGEVRNNIFYNSAPYWSSNKTAGSLIAENNLLFRTGDIPLEVPSPTKDLWNQDPLFVSTDALNLHLEAVSPAVRSGTDLSASGWALDRDGVSRPTGAWDIGPYQYHGEYDRLPRALIKVDRDSGYEPLEVRFDGALSYRLDGGNITSYQWSFGDGTKASGPQVVHSFREGTFNTLLTVTDSAGQTATAEKRIASAHATFPNLYLYLPFEGSARDYSGKSMEASWIGDAAYETSPLCRGAALDGSSGIGVENSLSHDGLRAFTLAIWAKKNTLPQVTPLIYKHTVYNLSLTASGFDGSFLGQKISYGSGPSDLVWHHYALTYDGASARLYLDGVPVVTKAVSGALNRGIWWGIVIGKDPWGTGLRGAIDDVRLYDRALVADEVRALFELPQQGPGACLPPELPAAPGRLRVAP